MGRQRPGVKHDHADAVLEVREVEKNEFYAARDELKKRYILAKCSALSRFAHRSS
jgi:hypothetical protein